MAQPGGLTLGLALHLVYPVLCFDVRLPAGWRCDVGCAEVLARNAATFRFHDESEPVNRPFRHESRRVRRRVDYSACLQHPQSPPDFYNKVHSSPILLHYSNYGFIANLYMVGQKTAHQTHGRNSVK